MRWAFVTAAILLCISDLSISTTGSSIVTITQLWASRQRRALNDDSDSPELEFNLRYKDRDIRLQLKRNTDINKNIPVFELKEKDGKLEKTNLKPQETTEYIDKEHGGVFTVRCIKRSNGRCRPTLEGSINIDGDEYIIEPKEDGNSLETRTMGDTGEYYIHKEKTEIINNDHDSVKSKRTEKEFKKKSQLSQLKELLGLLKRRVKRQKEDFGIELWVMLDYSIYKTWYDKTTGTTSTERKEKAMEKAREYYAHIINGIDLRYSSISSAPFSIYIRLQGYVFATTSAAAVWNAGILMSDPSGGSKQLVHRDILSRFRDAIRKKDYFNGLPNDHIMLFTGYEMYYYDRFGKLETGLTGLSYVGGICEDSRVSVIESHGAFHAIGTATHELGHNLGADHDGEGNACKFEDQYIMASQSGHPFRSDSNKLNPWKFSECSVQAFEKHFAVLDTHNQNCLRNTASFGDKLTWEKHMSNLPGQLYDTNEQCKQAAGDQSRLCTSLVPNINDICQSMYCAGTDGLCLKMDAARGTTCGNHKWCINGQCKFDEKAPAMDESCPYGDRVGAVYQSGETCEKAARLYPWECKTDYLKTACCNSCNPKTTTTSTTTTTTPKPTTTTTTTTTPKPTTTTTTTTTTPKPTTTTTTTTPKPTTTTSTTTSTTTTSTTTSTTTTSTTTTTTPKPTTTTSTTTTTTTSKPTTTKTTTTPKPTTTTSTTTTTITPKPTTTTSTTTTTKPTTRGTTTMPKPTTTTQKQKRTTTTSRVTTGKSKTTEESCPFGDRSGSVYATGETCVDVVKKYPRECKSNFMKTACCYSCNPNAKTTTTTTKPVPTVTTTTTSTRQSETTVGNPSNASQICIDTVIFICMLLFPFFQLM